MISYQEVVDALNEDYAKQSMLSMMRADGDDAFKLLVATALSARAKDETTIPIVKKLFAKYPGPEALVDAPLEDIEKIIKPIGFYRVKAKRVIEQARYVLEHFNGEVPKTLEELVEIPGVGRKTANCLLVYAFGKDAIPVDTHVHRISNILGWITTKTPEETEIALMKTVPKELWKYINEILVVHGQKVCKPISPLCSQCKLNGKCPRIGVTVSR